MAYSTADSVTDSWNHTVKQNTTEAAPRNCMLTSSSDGTGDLVSPEAGLLITKLKAAVFVPLIFFFGAPTNILNMIVFKKHGLTDRVNVCLFSLAVVDFVTLCFYFLLYSEYIFIFNTRDNYGPVSSFIFNNKIAIFYSCTYGSMFLSAIIALERCFCVLFPLHVKSLLTTEKMAAIILTGVPIISFLRLVVMAKYVVVCFFDVRTRITYMDLYITDYQAKNKDLPNFIDGIFYGLIIAVGCPVIVLITTVITSFKLWHTVAWRQESSTAGTRKEMAVTKMLILLSLQFLVFTSPLVFLRMYPLFNPEFNAKGNYRIYLKVWINVGDVFILTGLTFSFVVYYFASTKYRQTLHNLFKRRRLSEDTVSNKNMFDQIKTAHNKPFKTGY